MFDFTFFAIIFLIIVLYCLDQYETYQEYGYTQVPEFRNEPQSDKKTGIPRGNSTDYTGGNNDPNNAYGTIGQYPIGHLAATTGLEFNSSGYPYDVDHTYTSVSTTPNDDVSDRIHIKDRDYQHTDTQYHMDALQAGQARSKTHALSGPSCITR